MSDRNTVATPERRNQIRYPREFLLEDGARISWVTTESFESIRGREVSRFSADGEYLKTKIVEEVTTEEMARKIMETERENVALSLASQGMDVKAGNSVEARVRSTGNVEEGEAVEGRSAPDEEDVDYLAPCEGTFPVCCAADLSPEVSNLERAISVIILYPIHVTNSIFYSS